MFAWNPMSNSTRTFVFLLPELNAILKSSPVWRIHWVSQARVKPQTTSSAPAVRSRIWYSAPAIPACIFIIHGRFVAHPQSFESLQSLVPYGFLRLG